MADKKMSAADFMAMLAKRQAGAGESPASPAKKETKVKMELEDFIRKAQMMRSQVAENDVVKSVMKQGELASVFHNENDTAPELSIARADLSRVGKNGPIRVAAYIRVSTTADNQEDSYEIQEQYFNGLLIKKPNWVSAGVYSDYGLSGVSSTHRTGFQRLMRHVEEKKIDHIICKSISRFTRNTGDFLAALKLLRENQVTIFFEKENLDTADATSNFILTTLGAIAQEESRSISENIMWGIKRRYPKGEVRNFCIYGYRYGTGEDAYTEMESGYRYKKLVIYEPEAKVVRRIFEDAIAGKPFIQIARELNYEGVPAPATLKGERINIKEEKGKLGSLKDGIEAGWDGQMVANILRSERYCGEVLLQKSYTENFLSHQQKRNNGERPQYLVQDHHEAIISKELYEQAKMVLEANKRKKKSSEAKEKQFTKRLVCGCCGRFYHSSGSGAIYPTWGCPTASTQNGMGNCSAVRVYEEQIIRAFRKACVERFQLTSAPIIDDVKVEDILSGRYDPSKNPVSLSSHADRFVGGLRARVESIQCSDNLERDRSFLKSRIQAQQKTSEGLRRQVQLERSRYESLKTRMELLQDPEVTKEMVQKQLDAYYDISGKLDESDTEVKKLEERIAKMEAYWDQLEKSFEAREKLLEWMEELPAGPEGAVHFLDGLVAEHVKALTLSITIHDPLHFTFHWFDDSTTKVELMSNIEDHRYTAAYWNGYRMVHPSKRRR